MGSLDIIRGRQVIVPLVNRSGGAVAAGDVVVIGDGTNDSCFTTTTTTSFNARHIGIAQEAIASLATGRVLTNGYAAVVNSAASLTRDQYLFTSTVAKEATASATRAAGAFGQVLTTGTDTVCLIWGVPDATAAAGGSSAFSGARLSHSVAHSISNNAWNTSLPFDAETFDVDGWHDTATNNSRITVPAGKAGKIDLTVTGYWANAGGGAERLLGILKNGAAASVANLEAGAHHDPATVNRPFTFTTGPIAVVATDFFEVAAFQDSGAALNLTKLRFTVEYLGS